LTDPNRPPQNAGVRFLGAPEARGRSRLLRAVGRRAAAFALAVAVSIPLTFATRAAPEKRDTQNQQLTFSLRDTNGAPVDLQKFRGRVVLVNFFATWCEPCRDELPSLGRLVERTGDKAPVVIAISVGEPLPRVARFLDKTPVNFPVLLDETRAVTKSWEVEMLPSTFVLDEELRLRLIVKGDHNWDDVDATALPERLVAPSDSH
jgi:peroxiredoxin